MSIRKWWNSLTDDQKMIKMTAVIILITIITFLVNLKISIDTGNIVEKQNETLMKINTNVYQTKPILKEAHECVSVSSEDLNNLGIHGNLSKNNYLGENYYLTVKNAPEKSINMEILIPNSIEIAYNKSYPDVKIKRDNYSYPGNYAIIGYWKQEIEPGDKVKLLILYDFDYNQQLITGGRTFTFSSPNMEQTTSTFDCSGGFKKVIIENP